MDAEGEEEDRSEKEEEEEEEGTMASRVARRIAMKYPHDQLITWR